MSAVKKRVSGCSYVVPPSMGQLKRSRLRRAASSVVGVLPNENTGPNTAMAKAVNLSQCLCVVWVMTVLRSAPRGP